MNTTSKNQTANLPAEILIGGAALQTLGHERYTDDRDFLVDLPGQPVFVHAADGDRVNAAASNFLAAVRANCQPTADGVADPQTIAELKAWALVNCYQNFDFRAAAKHEYDLGFLVHCHGVRALPILAKFAHAGELAEVNKIITRAIPR